MGYDLFVLCRFPVYPANPKPRIARKEVTLYEHGLWQTSEHMKLLQKGLETQVAEHSDELENGTSELPINYAGRKQAGQASGTEHAMKRVLAESFTAEQTAAKALQGFCETLGWNVGVLWMADDRKGRLRCAEIWCDPNIQADEFKTCSREMTFERGTGLPGRVWESNGPVWISDVVQEANFARASMAAQPGLHGAFALPIPMGNRVGAVIEFFSLAVQEQDEGLLRSCATLARQLGQFLERKESEAAARRTEELYRRAISGADSVPYSYDCQTKSYLFMGEGIERMIGYTPQEIAPTLWNQITQETVMFGEADGLDKAEAARRVLRGEIRNWRCDMRVLTRSGESRWISDASVHTYDGSGHFTGSIGILQDITERKQAEVISQAFSKLGQSLMSATTPLEAARSIADIADELFGWDACAFYLYFSESNMICPVFYVDTFEDGRRDVLAPEEFTKTEPGGIDSRVIKNGAELTLKEGPLTMQEGAIPYGNKSRPSASIMRVPIHAGNRVVGIINIHSYTLQAYSRKNLTVLQTLANYCGGALERIWAENAQRKSESQFRVVWDSSVDAMRLTNKEGMVVQVNDAYCRMVQKSKAELEGHPLSIVYAEEAATRLLTNYKECADAKAIEPHSEREVALWNGRTIWLAVSNSRVELPGQPELLLSILRDVSERKQAEAELAYERDLLKTLLENSPDPIYFKDNQSRFIKCSESLSGRLGLSHEELVGKCDSDLFTEQHAREAFEDELRIMRTGEPVIAKIENEISKTGVETWVLTSKMPFRSKAGEIVGTFGISKDITAIKQAKPSWNRYTSNCWKLRGRPAWPRWPPACCITWATCSTASTSPPARARTTSKSPRLNNLGRRRRPCCSDQRDDLAAFFTNGPQGPAVARIICRSLRSIWPPSRRNWSGKLS